MSNKKDSRVKGPHEVTEAGENIFAAIGFNAAESAELLMRSQLLTALAKWRKNSGMNQTQAAEVLEISQARVSDIERGKFEIFSLDKLVQLAARAGLKPVLKLAA